MLSRVSYNMEGVWYPVTQLHTNLVKYDTRAVCHFLLYRFIGVMNVVFCPVFRDGPFDIRGGGVLDFSSRQVIFFLSFLHNKLLFSKVNCNKFFLFF